MNIPADLKYTKEHEWVKVEGDVAIVGITDYAQGELGDIVFVELPETGKQFKQMEAFGTIEAVKAVSEMFAPISGEVTEINTNLESDSSVINNDPYGEGWIIKLSNLSASEIDNLLDSETYKKLIED
jgi:glycine cleavage system H protein